MASSGEWCEEQLSKLTNEETRIPVLQEMKDFLTAVPREEASRTANTLQLPAVFDCLNDSNSEQVDLACEVLTLCMTNLNLGESTNKYGVFLERALSHPFAAVKLMALNELKRNIESEDILVDLCKRESLLISIITCVGDSDLEVAKQAVWIIREVGLSSAGIVQLSSEQILASLHEVIAISEIVRFRVYELLVRISVESEAHFHILKSTELFSQIWNELDNNDVLLRLNVLELLSLLGMTKHGYNYLDSNNILNKLVGMLEDDDVVTINLCEPGILKCFGNIAKRNPLEILSKYPNLYKRLFDNLEIKNFTILNVSMDTLGYIGETNDGKIALDSTGPLMENAVRTIAKSLVALPTEVKVRGLSCLRNLLNIFEPNSQIRKITRKWYTLLGKYPMDLISNYAKSPFSELRFEAFEILRVIAEEQWAQEDIRDYPGLVEFLLNRNAETHKVCKEAKFEIVKVLASSDLFDAVTLRKFQRFVEEGPHYVRAVTEVVVEGNE